MNTFNLKLDFPNLLWEIAGYNFPSLFGKWAIFFIFIAISFVFTLGMGYLSTKPDLSDWIKEIVNTVGQALFMTSAIIFKKKGLEDINSLNLKKSKAE